MFGFERIDVHEGFGEIEGVLFGVDGAADACGVVGADLGRAVFEGLAAVAGVAQGDLVDEEGEVVGADGAFDAAEGEGAFEFLVVVVEAGLADAGFDRAPVVNGAADGGVEGDAEVVDVFVAVVVVVGFPIPEVAVEIEPGVVGGLGLLEAGGGFFLLDCLDDELGGAVLGLVEDSGEFGKLGFGVGNDGVGGRGGGGGRGSGGN